MPIIGFGFNKINVEKKAQLTKQDKVQNHIRIKEVKETKIRFSNEEKEGALILFEFIVDYSNAGKLALDGNLIYYESEEKIKDIISSWEKSQKVPPAFGVLIYNYIMSKSNIKALQLEEEVGLPFHLRLPRVKVKQD